jgi:hypothetical protein
LSGFDQEWLALRELHDQKARNRRLIDLLSAWFTKRPRPRRIVDFGAGTGALARAIGPLLPSDQQWVLLDRDPALLSVAKTALPGVTIDCIDFSRDIEQLNIGPVDLVAASALLDLVSAEWLETLAALCAAEGAATYVSLSVDGRVVWDPNDPDDVAVHAAFAADQQRDKGFGAALGADANDAFARALGRRHYAITRAPSDWLLGPEETQLQRAFLFGIRDAAVNAAPGDRERWNAWSRRRDALITAGRSRLRVGHNDLLGLPPTPQR